MARQSERWVYGDSLFGRETYMLEGTDFGIERQGQRGWFVFKQFENKRREYFTYRDGRDINKSIYFLSIGEAKYYIESFVGSLNIQRGLC